MHSSMQRNGGDLQSDTVTIIGATLDLQDKTVTHAMTPIENVFMLHIDAKLDYDTLRKICATGHSRVPVYEEVEISLPKEVVEGSKLSELKGSGEDGPGVRRSGSFSMRKGDKERGEVPGVVKRKVKKIIGILLVKQCVLLDPEGESISRCTYS